jgi:hypothetical protein
MRSLVGLIIIGLGVGTFAAEKPASTVPPGHPAIEQPALPAGHPPLPATNQAKPGLPAGHPQVPAGDNGGGTAGGLPAGHPQIPAGGGGNAAGLPSGHPQVNAVPAPPGTKGSIVIKAVQATKGGPAVGADAITVEYYNAQGEVAGKTQATLSDKGEAAIKDVPLTVPVQPLITITHGGVEYKAPGNVMDANNRDQEVAVNVYEVTDREPAWQVRMRHVIVEPTRDGLNVTEMISVFNPSDRSWTGRATGAGKPVTLELALPPTATNLKAGGAFHERFVKVENGKLLNSMAMLPGGADFQVHYVIPAVEKDRAEVTLWAPATTGSLYVFLPQDGTVVTSDELRLVEAKAGAQLRANSRFYTAPPQNAGDVIKFTVSGLKGLKAASAAAVSPYGGDDAAASPSAGTGGATAGIPRLAKVVGAVGAGAILTVGTAVVLFKSPKAAVGAKR